MRDVSRRAPELSRRSALGLAAVALGGVVLPALSVTPASARETAVSRVDSPWDGDWATVGRTFHDMARKVWPRLWPEQRMFRTLTCIVADENHAVEVTLAGSRPLSVADLQAGQLRFPGPAGFSTGSWKGGPAVVVNPQPGPFSDPYLRSLAGTFELANHEAFHQHVQFASGATWPAAELNAPQFEDYPLLAEPRIQRAMAHNRLRDAYVDPARRASRLAAAAFWHEAWAADHPAERRRLRFLDTIEGTADYVGVVSRVLAVIDDPDCRRARHDHLARVIAPIDRLPPTGTSPATLEGYRLGRVAGVLLDDTRPGWRQSVITGTRTPAELAIAGIRPVPEPADERVASTLRDAVDARMMALAPAVDPAVAAVADPSHPLLVIPPPPSSADGTPSAPPFTGDGPFRSGATPYAFTVVAAGTYTSAAGTLRATTTAVFDYGEGRSALALHPEQIRFDGRYLTLGGTGTVGGPGLEGRIAVTASTVAGRTVYTVT